MSFVATRWVWENSPRKTTTLPVQLALADFANDEGLAWPAATTLGDKVGLKKSAVWEALRRLQETGQIEKLTAGGTAQQRTTVFRLHLLGAEQVRARPGGHEPTDRSTGRGSSSSRDQLGGSCPPARTVDGWLFGWLPPEFEDDVRARRHDTTGGSDSGQTPQPELRPGSPFSSRCVVAWPTAPTHTSQGTIMTMSCAAVPERTYLFTEVTTTTHSSAITPSTGPVQVVGQVVDVARSDYGYAVLVVDADSVAK